MCRSWLELLALELRFSIFLHVSAVPVSDIYLAENRKVVADSFFKRKCQDALSRHKFCLSKLYSQTQKNFSIVTRCPEAACLLQDLEYFPTEQPHNDGLLDHISFPPDLERYSLSWSKSFVGRLRIVQPINLWFHQLWWRQDCSVPCQGNLQGSHSSYQNQVPQSQYCSWEKTFGSQL